MDSFAYRAGGLCCEDVPAADIAESIGTPTYVYSKHTIVDHFTKIKNAFAELDPLICYSIKSCSNLSICKTLVDLGSGMDVVSGGELERATLAGCPPEKMVYAGVGKTDAEIRAALSGTHGMLGPIDRKPIGWFNIESEEEFENIARIAREMNVVGHGALRVNPDVDPKTHVYTTTGKKETKFGVDLERAAAFFEKYGRDKHLRLDAIHIHLGSPIYTTEPYEKGITKVLGLIDRLERDGHRITAIDLGGGFGADYESDRSPSAIDYAAAIVPLLRDRVRAGTKMILEPGRSIVANAGVLLTRVLYTKQGGNKTFVVTDAGMHTLIRPSLYGSFHFIWPANPEPLHVPAKRAEKMEMSGLVPCDVVGPICESSDFLAKDRALPPVKRGDLLAVFGAGAYGMTMASNYNTHTMPAEVMVDRGAWRVVRARQGLTDLLASERAAL